MSIKNNFSSLIKSKIKNNESFLSIGLNTSPDVEKKLYNKFLLPKETFRYSNSITKRKIIDFISKINKIDPNQVALVNGGRLAIYLSLIFFIKPKKIIIQDLFFDITGEILQQLKIQFKKKIIFWKRDKNFVYNLNDIKKELDSETVLLFNSPHNPTGWTADGTFLKNLSKLIKNKKSFLISDEVYKFIGPSSSKGITKINKNVIIFGSFSKLLSAPGLRLGYIISHKSNILKFNKNYFNLFACFNELSLKQTIILIKKFNKINHLICKNIETNLRILSKYKNLYQYKNPTNGYYRVIKIPRIFKNSNFFAFHLLKKHNLAVKPCTNMGRGGNKLIRISMITNPKLFKKGISILSKLY